MNSRELWRERLLAGGGALLFSLAFNHTLLTHLGALPIANDWDVHMHWYWVATQTVLHFHQFPLWSPWACGGSPLLAAPESHVLTPFFLLELLFGPALGYELEIILAVALAVVGGYALARVLGISALAAIPCAVIFPASSALYLHLGEGHGWALTYCFAPGILALTWYSATRHHLLSAALAGVGVAVVVNSGGIYPAPHLLLLISVLMILQAARQRSAWPLVALAGVGLFTGLFCAAKILPTLEMMTSHPRLIESHESNGLSVLYQALLGSNQDKYRGDLPIAWGFHEYGAYVGPAAAALAVVGALLARQRNWPWTVAALLFAALGTGDYLSLVTQWPNPGDRTSLSPWVYLHQEPFFSSQHVPSRFWVTLVIALGVLASYGLEEVRARAGTWALVAGLLVMTAGTADAFVRGTPNLAHMFDDQVKVLPSLPTFEQQFEEATNGHHPLNMYARAVANAGALNCYDNLQLETAPHAHNQPGYLGEQYFARGKGAVQLISWTPNELSYEVDVTEPGVLAINQNYAPQWRLAAGTGRVIDAGGLLGVSLPPGHQSLKLRYLSRPFAKGLLLLILGWALLALLIRPALPAGAPRWALLSSVVAFALVCAPAIAPALGAPALGAPAPPPDAPCFPYGEPLPAGPLKNTDALDVCARGPPFPVPPRGMGIELSVACKPGSLRAGWHWHSWCLADGTACNGNRDEFVTGANSDWNVGELCTHEGSATPGPNGQTLAW